MTLYFLLSPLNFLYNAITFPPINSTNICVDIYILIILPFFIFDFFDYFIVLVLPYGNDCRCQPVGHHRTALPAAFHGSFTRVVVSVEMQFSIIVNASQPVFLVPNHRTEALGFLVVDRVAVASFLWACPSPRLFLLHRVGLYAVTPRRQPC